MNKPLILVPTITMQTVKNEHSWGVSVQVAGLTSAQQAQTAMDHMQSLFCSAEIVSATPEPKTTGLTFDKALVAIKEGKWAGRAAWDGTFIFLHVDGPRVPPADILAEDWYIVEPT